MHINNIEVKIGGGPAFKGHALPEWAYSSSDDGMMRLNRRGKALHWMLRRLPHKRPILTAYQVQCVDAAPRKRKARRS